MNEMGAILKDYWAVFAGFVGAIVWFSRVEGRTTSNEKEIKRLVEQRKEDLQNAQRSRDEQSKKLDEMREDTKEIRQDIKTLLGRGI